MASGLEDFLPKKHVTFFKRCIQVLPPRYASLDTTRMTVAFFALSGLDMLDALDVISKEKQETVEWIYSLQVLPNSAQTNLGICGFRGSTTIGRSTDTEDNKYDCGHIAMTYTALLSLLILDDDLSKVSKKGVISGLKKLQLPDGSFCPTPDRSENDMRFVYCACCISYIIDDWSGVDKDKIIEFITNSLSYEGAFGQGPGLEAHGGSTFCAVASLVLMGNLHTALTPPQLDKLTRWCILRQQSGFQGRPNKPVDTCYSFWVGATLKLLGAFEMCNFEANKFFLMETQDTLIGGFAKCPDNTPDTLHAYFGVCGLSLMNEPGVEEMNAALNISKRSADRLKSIHKKWGEKETSHVNIIQNKTSTNCASTAIVNGNCSKSLENGSVEVIGDRDSLSITHHEIVISSNVPKLQMDQHAIFLKTCIKSIHNPHAPLDTSRVTSVHHALVGLDLLNALYSLSGENKTQIIDWIYSLQILPTLDSTSSTGYITSKTPVVQPKQLDLTYSAICILITLEDNLSQLNKDIVINHLRVTSVHHALVGLDLLNALYSLSGENKTQIKDWIYSLQISSFLSKLKFKTQKPDLGIDGNISNITHPTDSGTDLKCTYCAICISCMLQDFRALNVPKVVQNIKRCMHADGYFLSSPNTPSKETREIETFWAVASIVALLGSLSSCLSGIEIDKISNWCKQRRKCLYQMWDHDQTVFESSVIWCIEATLHILGCQKDDTTTGRLLQIILNFQHDGLGGFSTPTSHGQLPDIHHSYYSLTTLALTGLEGMSDINPKLAIGQTAINHMQKLWKNSGGVTAL